MRNPLYCRLALLHALCLTTSAPSAATLTTSLSTNNNQQGVMFDLTVGTSNLRITGFDIFTQTTNTFDVELYMKSGTWVGSDTTPADWTLVGSTNLTGGGASTLVFLDTADFTLAANSTFALYLTTVSIFESIRYTSGTATGSLLAGNSDLTIYEGAGKAYAFSTTYAPRDFTGTIYYDVVPEPEAGSAVLLTGMLGFFGLRRRRAQQRKGQTMRRAHTCAPSLAYNICSIGLHKR